jgi:hypothetical protein
MSHVHADINPQDNAVALVDQQPPVFSLVDSLPEETTAIGTFATGLTNHQPRPWSSKQMVGDRHERGK